MRNILIITGLSIICLLTSLPAAIGESVQSFTASDYAKEIRATLKSQRPDITVFTGEGGELIVLKTRRDIIYFEQLSWLHYAQPDDPGVRQQVYIGFLAQAAGIQPGSPVYTGLVDKVHENSSNFTLLDFSVQIRQETTPNGIKYSVTIENPTK